MMEHPDSQIFSDTQQTLEQQYLSSTVPETDRRPASGIVPDEEPPPTTEAKPKKDESPFASPRSVLSTFELYETKTVSSR